MTIEHIINKDRDELDQLVKRLHGLMAEHKFLMDSGSRYRKRRQLSRLEASIRAVRCRMGVIFRLRPGLAVPYTEYANRSL